MADSVTLNILPDVSVIVTTYNSERYLGQALTSLADQTYKNFEIILVDDGSTSRDAQKLAEQFASSHELPIRYYYKENGGPSSARNLGLKHAVGKYVAFLDSDDFYDIDKLTRQKEMLGRLPEEYCCVVGAACKFDDRAHSRQWIKVPPPLEGFLDIEKFLLGEMSIEGTPGYLFRRSALMSVNGYDEYLSNNEDFDLLLRLAVNFKIKTHADVTFHRRLRSDSLSKANPILGLRQSLKFISKAETLFSDIDAHVFARRKQKAFFNAAFLCLKKGRIANYKWLIKRGVESAGGISTWRGYCAYLLAMLLPVRSRAADLHDNRG